MGPEGAPPDGPETSYPSTPTGRGDDYDEVLGYSDTSPQHADLDDDRHLSFRDGSFLSGGRLDEADIGKEDDGDKDGDTRFDDVLRDEAKLRKDDDDDQEEAHFEDTLKETFPDPKGHYLGGDYAICSPINEVHDEEEHLPIDSPARHTSIEGEKTTLPPKQSKSTLNGMFLISFPFFWFICSYIIFIYYYLLYYIILSFFF